MRKITKRGLIRKLDKVFSAIVRSRGSCAKCNKTSSQVTLHCAHIMSRKNMNVRWDFDNALALCYYDHFWWAHQNPILFTKFCEQYLGREKFSQLIMKSTLIKKWSISEMQNLLTKLVNKPPNLCVR